MKKYWGVRLSSVQKHWRVMQSLKKNWLLVPKMTRGIWLILMQAVRSLKNLRQKSTDELSGITLKNDGKFEEKLPYALKNDISNLANFDSTVESLKIYTLMGSFWPKYHVWAKKVRISYRTVPSTIWPIFSEFLIFCWLISWAFRRVK